MAATKGKGAGAAAPLPGAARRVQSVPPPVLLESRTRMGVRGLDRARLPEWLERLATLDLEGLKAEWLERFGVSCPAIQSRDVLRRLLAWRVQASVFGGFDQPTLRRLRQLMADYAADKPLAVQPKDRLSQGTVLSREWKGRVHQVTVEAKTYVYEGKAYASLSEIARLITGTRWSGPRLFGLEKYATPGARP